MGLEFTPPESEKMRYAVYVEGGYRPFRMASSLGAAKSSHFFSNMGWSGGTRYSAKILERVNNKWYVLFDIAQGTKQEDLPWYSTVVTGWDYKAQTERTTRKAKPMTREEYATWRVEVELESRGITQ